MPAPTALALALSSPVAFRIRRSSDCARCSSLIRVSTWWRSAVKAPGSVYVEIACQRLSISTKRGKSTGRLSSNSPSADSSPRRSRPARSRLRSSARWSRATFHTRRSLSWLEASRLAHAAGDASALAERRRSAGLRDSTASKSSAASRISPGGSASAASTAWLSSTDSGAESGAATTASAPKMRCRILMTVWLLGRQRVYGANKTLAQRPRIGDDDRREITTIRCFT